VGHSIFSINFDKQERAILYSGIDTIEEARLLSQLAMIDKQDDELIFISAGWNRDIKNKQEEYNKALELAEEYRCQHADWESMSKENVKIFQDVSKDALIRSRQYFQNQNIELSNTLFNLSKRLQQVENDKMDLQVKLERARACVKCYECKDDTCINNIWHK